MFTKITRKVYDESGTETILGLPCKTVIDYWDGSASSNRVTIEDCFNIDDINIDDGHSTGVMSLLNRILEVKLQERLIPTTFELKSGFIGPSMNTDKSVDWNNIETDTLTEVTDLGITELDGIPILKAYKCSGNVSYSSSPIMNILLDNRETMDTYTTEGWDDCVYISLPKSIICENGELKDWVKKLLPSDANPENYTETTDELGITTNNGGNIYDEDGNPFITIDISGNINYNEKFQTNYAYAIIAICSKNYIDKVCILLGVLIGENGGDILTNYLKNNYTLGSNFVINDYTLYIIPIISYINGKQVYLNATGVNWGFRTYDQLVNTSVYKTKVYFGSQTSNYPGIFGQLGVNNNDSLCWYVYRNGNNIYYRTGDIYIATYTANTEYNIESSVSYNIVNGSKTSTRRTTYTPYSGNYCCIGNSPASNCAFIGKQYAVEWYENGYLKHLYLPVADDTMLDLVTKTVLTNHFTSSKTTTTLVIE